MCRWTESCMLSDAVRRGCSDAAAASVHRADLVNMIINLLRWLVALVAAVRSDDSATHTAAVTTLKTWSTDRQQIN